MIKIEENNSSYEVIDKFKVSWKFHVLVVLYTYIVASFLKNDFNIMIEAFPQNPLSLFKEPYHFIDFIIFMLIVLLIIGYIHEFIHYITFKSLGYKAKMGFKFIYAYTMETSGRPIATNKFLVVLLMPLLIISLVCFIFFKLWVFRLILYLNFFGSTGDIAMSIKILKYLKDTFILDKSYGFDIVKI